MFLPSALTIGASGHFSIPEPNKRRTYARQLRHSLNVGFAHRLKKMKKGIQLSKMIVTKQSFRKRMP
jgi:hypothetical protein